MTSKLIQKIILYLKETLDMSFFAIMSDSKWHLSFSGSPSYFIMMPLLGIFITLMAIINGYQLAKASNKNFDKWFNFIISGLCAVLASISLYGAVVSTVLAVAFPLGPWLFLGGIVLAWAHQAIILGLNLHRAYESLPCSVQRIHFIQAALNNLFTLGLIAAIVGAVVFIMLTPVAPVIGSAFAITVVTLTAANILWRMIPYNWKLSIKGIVHLAKPLLVEQSQTEGSLIEQRVSGLTVSVQNKRMFSQCDYSAEIRIRDLKTGISYLRDIIEKKIAHFNSTSIPKNEINTQKEELLSILLVTLDNPSDLSKKSLLEQYSLAFQSFWADKGEVEQLFDAVVVLKEKHLSQKHLSNQVTKQHEITVRDPLILEDYMLTKVAP